jgi:cephalosporin hydroxylase
VTVEDAVSWIDELALNGFPHEHVQLVCETVHEFQPDIICEWGTNQGNSGRMLYEAAVLSGCSVHSIEIGEQDAPPLLWDCDIQLHHGDGLMVTLFLTAPVFFERPLILIDDNHVYQETYDNLTALHQKRPHAVLLIHDSHANEANAAISAYLKQNGGYDVRESSSETGLMRLWPQSIST